MKTAVATSLGSVFALLSAFHVVGSFGILKSLPVIPTIPGKLTVHPSSLSWLAVAGALALATVVVLVRGDLLLTSTPPWLSTLACSVLGAVFVLRVMGDFRTFGLFKAVKGTPFAAWDTWLYTPLCLTIGLAALWLATTPRAR